MALLVIDVGFFVCFSLDALGLTELVENLRCTMFCE